MDDEELVSDGVWTICRSCGAVVAIAATHEEFHARLARDQEA